MQGLSILSILAYTILPHHPAAGVVFLYALSSVTNAFVWCVAVLLARKGRFDAHIYCIGGVITFLLPGSIMRVVSLAAMTGAFGEAETVQTFAQMQLHHFPYDMLIASLLGMLALLPAQMVMLKLLAAQRSEEARTGHVLAGLTRALGLADSDGSTTDMRRAFMEEDVARLRDEFSLSARESDMLALYVLGFTQNKIAEELHISGSTTHTHISHIYTKTGFHSRQEIIDYIDALRRKG